MGDDVLPSSIDVTASRTDVMSSGGFIVDASYTTFPVMVSVGFRTSVTPVMSRPAIVTSSDAQ